MISEMVREKSESLKKSFSSIKCSSRLFHQRQRINCSVWSWSGWFWFLSAVLLVSSLSGGIQAAESNGQEPSGSSAVGGGDHGPELQSIDHKIEEQCIQNCNEQVVKSFWNN